MQIRSKFTPTPFHLSFILIQLFFITTTIQTTWIQQCAWQNPETELYYNLTPLIKSTTPYYTSAGPSSDYFTVNICDIVTTEGCTEKMTTPVCQYSSNFYYSAGNITTQTFNPISYNSSFFPLLNNF